MAGHSPLRLPAASPQPPGWGVLLAGYLSVLARTVRLVGEHDRLDPVAEAELLEDVRDVHLHGRFADVDLLADLCVGQAGRDEPQDFVLRSVSSPNPFGGAGAECG